jgi:hypothetical protein
MATDWAAGLGGALSGAASGSAILPGVGTAIGAGLGFFSGLFGGAEAPEYQPTETEQAFIDYGLDRIKASKATKAAALSKFKSLVQSGNRGAAEAYLESQKDIYSNPEFALNRLKKSYKKPINYERKAFASTARSIFGQQGLGFTGDEYSSFAQQAKSQGIRSPQAFGDMLKRNLIASGKVMTPQQEMLSYIFGTPERDASGKLTNRYPTIAKVPGPTAIDPVTYKYGA